MKMNNREIAHKIIKLLLPIKSVETVNVQVITMDAPNLHPPLFVV